uniref:DUF4220 domain-containing protein n=2 Tax=Triticum urartu TaxID=4572 RepID=A0A8R7QHE4_TRIUA
MMYLLVEQPDMLPGLSQNRLYQLTCESLVKTWRSTHRRRNMNSGATLKNLFRLHDDADSNSRATDRDELAEKLYDEYESKSFMYDSPRLSYVAQLAKELLAMEKGGTVDPVKLVREVWTDILVYAGNKCSRKFHAEKLNSGGELTTILWLMAEHFYQIYLGSLVKRKKKGNDLAGEGISHPG